MRRKYILYITLLSSLLVFSNLIHAGRPKMPPPTVRVEEVKQVLESAPREYIGNIEAIGDVDLRARIYGIITDINFKEGSLIEKGKLLFTIEDTSYNAKMLAAKAEVAQATAEFQYAENNFKRQKLLSSKNAISKSILEDAKRLKDLKKALIQQKKAELLNAENELSYTKIYAPITGRIGAVKFTVGNYVTPESSPLAKIVSINPIQVKFSISERIFLELFKEIKPSYSDILVSIKLSDGNLYPYKGKIAFIDNLVDEGTGTIAVWAEFSNSKMKLVPGGYVTVLISEKITKPLLGVKLSAVMTDSSGSYVYTVLKNNVAKRTPVKLGGVIDNVQIITKGLKAGEQVVIDGTHKVIPNMPLIPYNNKNTQE